MVKKEDNLLLDYIKYFGEDAPRPPKPIMESLVKMKDDGSFDKVMEKILPEVENIKQRINDELGTDLIES